MSEFGTTARIVLTTAASGDEARTLARTLVEERLAACATIIPTVESIYRWEGKVETAVETLLLIKTAVGQVDALEVAATGVAQLPNPRNPGAAGRVGERRLPGMDQGQPAESLKREQKFSFQHS